jgi:hypothetical protein
VARRIRVSIPWAAFRQVDPRDAGLITLRAIGLAMLWRGFGRLVTAASARSPRPGCPALGITGGRDPAEGHLGVRGQGFRHEPDHGPRNRLYVTNAAHFTRQDPGLLIDTP